MVFSVKANKNKIIAAVAVVIILLCGIIFLPNIFEAEESYSGETNSQRIEFLNSFGWEVGDDSIDERNVTIPSQFSDIYTTYNVMQIAQGYDLEPYAGEICTQYIYLVENYPDEDGEIHATLLVYDGVIIGGDISCSELDGFMHGFAADSEYFGDIYVLESDETSSQDETEETDADITYELDKSGELVPVS